MIKPTTTLCSVDGCDNPAKRQCDDLCNPHAQRLNRYGRLHGVRRPNGTGTIGGGYASLRGKRQHKAAAEACIGMPLPAGAVVHHRDGNGLNNAPDNLIVFQSHSDHVMFHKRQDAFEASGCAHHRKCHRCHQYDDPASMRSESAGKGRIRYKHKVLVGMCHRPAEVPT